mgnify:CR=1 FL=1
MNNRTIFTIFIITTIFLSGCVNKKNIKNADNTLDNNPSEQEIKSLDLNNPDDLVLIDDDPSNDNIIKHCSDFDCFVNNFKECKESQIKKNNINYVIIGYSEKDDLCQFLLDKLSLGQGLKNCLFNKLDLTENLFKNLIEEENTAEEQNIIKEKCKEMSF